MFCLVLGDESTSTNKSSSFLLDLTGSSPDSSTSKKIHDAAHDDLFHPVSPPADCVSSHQETTTEIVILRLLARLSGKPTEMQLVDIVLGRKVCNSRNLRKASTNVKRMLDIARGVGAIGSLKEKGEAAVVAALRNLVC